MLGRVTGGKARPAGVSACDLFGELCVRWMPCDARQDRLQWLTSSTNAVSAKLFSAAMFCMTVLSRPWPLGSSTTAAGLPPNGVAENASTW